MDDRSWSLVDNTNSPDFAIDPEVFYDLENMEENMIQIEMPDNAVSIESKSLVEIQTILLDLKSRLQDYYRVATLGIFGSYARNEQHQNSDVDILIDYVKAPSLIKVIELRDYLSDRLNIKVDVVTVNGLRADIKEQVLSDVIYLWNVEA